jgi:TonB family protein
MKQRIAVSIILIALLGIVSTDSTVAKKKKKTKEIKKDPVVSLLEKAAVDLAAGEYDAALKTTQNALDKQPQNLDAHFLEGSALLRLGDVEAACVQLRIASLWIDALQWADELEGNRVLLEQALAQLQDEPEDSGSQIEFVRAKAPILVTLDRPDEALPLCERWWDLDEGSTGALECLVDLYTRTGAVDRAMTAVLRLEHERPEEPLASLPTLALTRGANFCMLVERTIEHLVDRRDVPQMARNSSSLMKYLQKSSPKFGNHQGLVSSLAACFSVLESGAGPGGEELDDFEGLEMSIPVPLRQVYPTYPELARVARVDGSVTVISTISTDGTVGDLKVLYTIRPNLGFEEAAIDAVKQWRFRPATLNGEPVEIDYRIVMDFSLH